MPSSIIQPSFAGGEYSPSLYSRVDIEKYKSGLRTARNFIIHPQGGASNRCGWKYIGRAKYSDSMSISQEFIFSRDQAYTLEFGNYYVRFYTDDAQILENGQPYEIATPYSSSDLANLNFESSADVIYITHPDYQQRTLTRYGNANWVLDLYSSPDGPFMPENIDESISLSVSAVTGSSVTLTVSATYTVDSTITSLLHFDGANGSTNITEETGRIVSVNGDAQISTAQSKFGGTSLYIDGTGDYVTMPTSSGFSFGTGKLTIDFWVYFNSFSSTPSPFALNDFNVDTNNYMFMQIDSTNFGLSAKSSGSTIINRSFAHALTTGRWYHIAVVRGWSGNANDWAITVDGTSVDTFTANVTMPASSGEFFIGQIGGGAQFLNGYIDEFRIMKGTAAWTSNFTPSTSAYSYTTADPGNFMFSPYHVGALFKLTHYVEGQTVSTSFSSATTSSSIKCFTTWRLITHGTWTGKFRVEKSTDGGTTWTVLRSFSSANDFNADTSGTEDIELNTEPFLVRINMYSYTSGTASIDLTSDAFYQNGIVRATAFVDTTHLTCEVLSEVGSTTQTNTWSEGSWSDYRGWPSVARFFQDRLCFASTYAEQMTIWMTKIGNYTSYARNNPLLDTDGITVNLPSRQLNAINGLIAFKKLLPFTSSSVWSVGPISGSALTPTSIQQDVEEYSGSSNTPPVVVSSEAIYCEVGGDNIRSLGFQLASDGFVGSETNILAKHLFDGYTITKMAYQRKPNGIIWCLRSDGVLLSFTYLKEQEVVAWAHHDTDGTIESICVIPGANSDELWAIINRDNGRFVEKMEGRKQHSLTNHVFLDSYTTALSSTTTISDLTHLSNQVVGLVGDDDYIGTYTVSSSGTISVSSTYTTSHVGLLYNCDLETLNIEVPTKSGTIQGNVIKIGNVVFRFINTRGGYIGPNSDNLYEAFYYDKLNSINWSQNRGALGATDNFTGDVRVPLGAGYENGGRIFYRQSKPLPVTISAIIPEVEFGGRSAQ